MRYGMTNTKVAMVGIYPLGKIYGGVEAHFYHLAHRIARLKDVELHVIRLGTNNEQFKRDNIQFHILRNLYFHPFNIIRLKKAILKINPDVVHVQKSSFPYIIIAILIRKKYPTLLTVHGLAKKEFEFERGIHYILSRFICKPLEKYVVSKVPNIIVVTPYVKESLCNINTNIYIIPNGVNNEYFKIKVNEKSNQLLFVGQISPRKGLIDLLKAIKIVIKKIPDVKLDIIGNVLTKRYFDTLISYTKTNKLEETINFVGYLNDKELKQKYSEATLFVFPSYEESQGIVLLEAMACGIPVVASNIGGIPFVVEDGKTGVLFECGNVEELAEQITVLLKDEKLRKKMGAAGRERAEEFSWAKIADQTVAVYREICQE